MAVTKKKSENKVQFSFVIAYGSDRVKAVVAVASTMKAAEAHIVKLQERRTKVLKNNGVKDNRAKFFVIPVEKID